MNIYFQRFRELQVLCNALKVMQGPKAVKIVKLTWLTTNETLDVVYSTSAVAIIIII